VPRGQAIRFQQGRKKCTQPLRAGAIDARLPILQRAPIHAHAGGKLALGQARPPAVAQ
jgi:hypothetical protein